MRSGTLLRFLPGVAFRHPVIFLQVLRSGTLLSSFQPLRSGVPSGCYLLQALHSSTLLPFFQALCSGTLSHFQVLRSSAPHCFYSGVAFRTLLSFFQASPYGTPLYFQVLQSGTPYLLSLCRCCPLAPCYFSLQALRPGTLLCFFGRWNLAHPTISLQVLRYDTLLSTCCVFCHHPGTPESRLVPALIESSCVMFGNMMSLFHPRNILASGWPLTGILVHDGVNDKPFLHDKWTLHLDSTTLVS